MPKVLIIGPNYFHFNCSVKTAFENAGWRAHIEGYDTPIHPFDTKMRWKRKFSLNRNKLQQKQNEKFNRYVMEVFKREQPDLVFVLNGEILIAETLDIFRQTSKVALWLYDTLLRYPAIEKHIYHVDAFFCYEMNDVEHFRKQGKIAYFLPQACDEKQYFPLHTPKDIDILFVGIVYRYNKRIELLKAVTECFTDKKILIVGKYKPFEKNPIKWFLREKRKVYINKNVLPEEVNCLYSRAKIVLNIHHETQKDGANPKVFEICGAGTYQICDANPYIESLFRNGEVGLYYSEEELIACINEALTHDKSENARKAQQLILEGHTFIHRVTEVLKVLQI